MSTQQSAQKKIAEPQGAANISVEIGPEQHVFIHLHDDKDNVFAFIGLPEVSALKLVSQISWRLALQKEQADGACEERGEAVEASVH